MLNRYNYIVHKTPKTHNLLSQCLQYSMIDHECLIAHNKDTQVNHSKWNLEHLIKLQCARFMYAKHYIPTLTRSVYFGYKIDRQYDSLWLTSMHMYVYRMYYTVHDYDIMYITRL